MTPAIRTDKLTKCFTRQRRLLDYASGRNHQEIIAIDRINLEVKPSEIFGLLGPNGAGKTTLIKLLCTLLLPSSGEASIYGHDVVREAHTVRQLVGLVTCEERSFFWRLTGRQNLQFFAALYQLPQRQAASRIAELFQLLELAEVGDIRFNEYSTGMRQKLAIARGLLSHPKILFLDEPTKGLDPISAQVLLSLIRQRVVDSLGSTIILTSHILRDIEQLCDRVGMLHKGKLIACGSLEELRFVSRQHEQYRVKVRGLSEESLRILGRVPGIVKCRKLSQVDGVSEIAINIRKDETALSEALKYMLYRRCDILSCVLEEEKLEEVFTNLLQEVATPALRGGSPGT